MLVKFNSTTHHFEVNILLVHSIGPALALGEKNPSAPRTRKPPQRAQPCGILSNFWQEEAAV